MVGKYEDYKCLFDIPHALVGREVSLLQFSKPPQTLY